MTRRGSVLTVAVFLTLAQSLTAVEYHDYFVGFTTELAVSSDLRVAPLVPDSLSVESVSFSATWGPAATRPLRFRAGMGWFPSRPFVVFAGLELPLYERLNRSRARSFGLYLLGDLGITIPMGWSGDLVLAVQLPTSALGGLQLGLGVNQDRHLLITFNMATGAHPIRPQEQGAGTENVNTKRKEIP